MKKGNLHSADETFSWGQQLGMTLLPNTVLALYGDLGAGKTTLIKGIASGFAAIDPKEITSPTFTYLNTYPRFFHFDLYRLKGGDDFLALGFDDYFQSGGVCCIEWPEKIEALLPPHTIKIELNYIGAASREVVVHIP